MPLSTSYANIPAMGMSVCGGDISWNSDETQIKLTTRLCSVRYRTNNPSLLHDNSLFRKNSDFHDAVKITAKVTSGIEIPDQSGLRRRERSGYV
jgi:hypothetical protein